MTFVIKAVSLDDTIDSRFMWLCHVEEDRVQVNQTRSSPLYRNTCVDRHSFIGEDGCRKSHKTEIHSWQYSPNIIRVIKLNRITLAGHVARMDLKKEREIQNFGGKT
jgi:hypothetical protein